MCWLLILTSFGFLKFWVDFWCLPKIYIKKKKKKERKKLIHLKLGRKCAEKKVITQSLENNNFLKSIVLSSIGLILKLTVYSDF